MREAIRGHQVPDEGVDQKGHQRVHQRHSGAIIGNQRSSVAIRGHQRHSGAIIGNQRSSEAIRGHQRHSGAIICNQWQSAYANPCGPVAMSGSRYALRSIVISPFSSNTLITWYAQHGSARHEVAILA